MTRNRITAELIQKFIDGNCTLEERASVILWYNHYDSEEDVLEQTGEAQKDQLRHMMLRKINSRINFAEKEISNKPKISSFLYWATGVAAVLLIVFGIFLYQTNKPEKAIANQNIKEAKLIVLENQGKTLYQRKLEDGTMIWLSPGAKIEMPEHFAKHTREVTMVGKVFFEVAKNPAKPFIIYGGGVVTKVLGTSFLVNAEQGKNTEVSVVTGKVSVTVSGKEAENVLLLPKQKGVFDTSKQHLEKEALAAKSEVQMWKKAKLSFDNVNIGEVTSVLADSFNVVITANDKIKSCRLKADFSDQNLASILEMLCKSIDATYEIKGNDISINGKGCSN